MVILINLFLFECFECGFNGSNGLHVVLMVILINLFLFECFECGFNGLHVVLMVILINLMVLMVIFLILMV